LAVRSEARGQYVFPVGRKNVLDDGSCSPRCRRAASSSRPWRLPRWGFRAA